jgi:propanol-preferring alcohol dehydrogenase
MVAAPGSVSPAEGPIRDPAATSSSDECRESDMKAAVLEQFNQPLVVREVPDLEPGAGEVLVRTRIAGICRTDLKIIEGAVPTVKTPVILGHELAGEVAAIGPGVRGVSAGARVAGLVDISCGTCRYCLAGELEYCARRNRLGFEHDGALAEYVQLPAVNLIPMPDGVTFGQAAMIPDAVGTPYHAVLTRGEVRPGQTVAVYGLGGLGLTAVQVGALAGARVIAIARTKERRQLAEELGATWSIDPNDGDVSAQVRELTDGFGVHAFIDLVGIEGSVNQGVLSCRRGGRVVVVGYFVSQLIAGMMGVVLDEIAILGSRGSTRAEQLEAIALVGKGQITPIIGVEIELDAINEGIDGLRQGSVIGRTQITFP